MSARLPFRKPGHGYSHPQLGQILTQTGNKDLTAKDLASPDLVFQIGLPPARIDILTTISGVSFDEAWERRVNVAIGTGASTKPRAFGKAQSGTSWRMAC